MSEIFRLTNYGYPPYFNIWFSQMQLPFGKIGKLEIITSKNAVYVSEHFLQTYAKYVFYCQCL